MRVFLITLGLIVAQLVTGMVGAQTIVTNGVQGVSPTSAPQGATNVTVTFNLDPSAIPPVPPDTVPPTSATIGPIAGTGLAHPSQFVVTAQFNIPLAEPTGLKTVAVVFPSPGGTLTYNRLAAFDIGAGSGVLANFTATPTSGPVPLNATFTDTSTGTISNRHWIFGDGTTTNITATSFSHTYSTPGSYTISLTVAGPDGSNTLARSNYITAISNIPLQYLIVDTGQFNCYNATTNMPPPAAGQPFYGQDAQFIGHQPSYTMSGDGLTVHDNTTGLTWQRSPEATGDSNLTAADKLTWAQAQARPAALNAINFGGYSDWRLPTIKELYSLIMFNGTDPSGLEGSDTSGLTPFINTNYFQFAYGDTSAGERIIDSQYASSTLYVSTAFGQSLFGVNFADGRIKGYGLSAPGGGDKTFFVQCVRGNPSYGINLFVDNGDQTVTDKGTGLMWSKADSATGLNWSNALAWVQAKNAANYFGHDDWRLPNAKELQSILDYTRSPDTSGSAAIDPIFTFTAITGENNTTDYPWYWSGTTHATYNGGGHSGAYVCFGHGWGYLNSAWVDVHGAGCQRSDPKGGSLSSYTYAPYGYYNSIAPQGDGVRIFNYVRLVRDAEINPDSVGDGIPDWWRAQYFGGDGTTTNALSCATCDPSGTGQNNLFKYLADLNPTNAASILAIISIATATNDVSLIWTGGANAWQYLECAGNLTNWTAIFTNVPPTAVTNSIMHTGAAGTSNLFYRVKARRLP